MMKSHKHIVIFEHKALWVNKGDYKLTEPQLEVLQTFHEANGGRYYGLINKGIKFKEYVGVIQVGNLIIEVLPKADNYSQKDEWRNILIGMLRAVGVFSVFAPTHSSLKLKNNSILELYFELFISEVEYLLNKGLSKKYRKTENNQLTLKGSIKFSTHLKKNFVHQERFYTRHTTYDVEHLLHQILYKTILLLKIINRNMVLNSRINALLLNFPEMKDLKVTEATFNKIVFNRKTEGYKKAIEISRLILLNYHPDLSKGQNNVLALMFNMNLLWEQFIYVSLKKYKHSDTVIKAQSIKKFWKPEYGTNVSIKPDIVFRLGEGDAFVLDTKWKNLGVSNPSHDDLRQLYVYLKYFEAKKAALIYPGESAINEGKYYNTDNKSLSAKDCSVLTIPPNKSISDWQMQIANTIFSDWLPVLCNAAPTF